jgi:AcrR family transcriptional regulator
VPKIVDHDQRRKELADAVLTLVARVGVNGVTVRSVAEEAGWSTGVLTHYYGSRAGLLLAALRRAAAVTRRDYQQGPLTELLEGVLPLDERRLALNRIFLFFYAEAATDEEIRREIAGYLANWRADVEAAVRHAQAHGALDAARDPREVAALLVALADAVSMHAIFDPAVMEQLRSRSPVPGWLETFGERSAVVG